MKYDFLIVGQGISGTVLGLLLKQYNKSFLIIDKNDLITSSKVAAGLMHPMSFKRCVLNWEGDRFYDYSCQFYKSCNTLFSKDVFKELKLTRLFSSYEEQNNWFSKAFVKPYNTILSPTEEELPNLLNEFGNGSLLKSAKLDVKKFLREAKNLFNSTKTFKEKAFVLEDLSYVKNEFHYENNQFKHLVMCQGTSLNIFNYLPLIPNKGELLTICSKSLPKHIVSKGVFAMPLSNNQYTVGATYNHRDENHNITKESKDKLLANLSKIIPIENIKVISQTYGFRPTTLDRKPFLGEHPIIKNAFIFNGMGSKSVLMTPLLGKQLLDHILYGKKISDLVDIKRYENYFTEHEKEIYHKLVT
tara:strand:+ start:144 stop:1220 length:1077 start_codon:yes stop_codon:yes gene_type:complete